MRNGRARTTTPLNLVLCAMTMASRTEFVQSVVDGLHSPTDYDQVDSVHILRIKHAGREIQFEIPDRPEIKELHFFVFERGVEIFSDWIDIYRTERRESEVELERLFRNDILEHLQSFDTRDFTIEAEGKILKRKVLKFRGTGT